MGREELLAALHEKAAAEKQAIWQRAEAAAATAEQEAAAAVERLQRQRQQAEQQQELALRRLLARRVERRLQRARLRTLAHLARRTEVLAMQLLADGPASARQECWPGLAGELPARDWETVRVHPDNVEAARKLFPCSRIERAPDLAGGLVVAGAGGALVIDNSLERRCQRLWPQLLGVLVSHLEAETGEEP